MNETKRSVAPADFVSAMNHFTSGVAVVTARTDDGRPVGATVAAIAPIASDPPTVMVSMSTASATAAAIIESGCFAVNVLDEDSALLAGVFASRAPDKFAGVDVHDDCLGSPLLPHRVSAVSCHVVDAVATGSHWELRGRPVAVDVSGGNPLAYYRGSFAHVHSDADRMVLDTVRAHVLSVRTDSDHRLDPDELAADLAVPRGAVLRALSRLKSEALVDREDGAYHVAAVPNEIVDAAYAAKLILELGVASHIVEGITDSEVEGIRTRLDAVRAAAELDDDDAIERVVAALDDVGEYFVGLAGSDPLVRAYRSLGLPGIDRRTITRAMLVNVAPGGGMEAVLDGLERRDPAAVTEALRSERRTPAYVRARERRERRGRRMEHTRMTEPHATRHEHADLSVLPSGVTPEAFTAAFRNHPAGVAVITARTAEGPVALTATSVVSVSAEPPVLIFSLSALSSASVGIRAAEMIVVHLLGEKDAPIAWLCASSGVDRFADTMIWSSLTTGEPLFHGVDSWLRCRIIDRMDAGGSTVVAAQAVQVSATDPSLQVSPLVYHNRAWHRLGEHSLLP